MKYCFYFLILFFLALPFLLSARDLQVTNTQLPEITELEYDNLELENWLPSPTGVLEGKNGPFLQIEARHNWKPGSDLLSNRLLISPAGHNINSVPQLYITGYQKLRKAETPVNLARAGLFANYNHFLKTLALGNFRLQAGEGMCLGSYYASSLNPDSSIHPARALSHPALTGVAAQFNAAGFDCISWLSQTSRIAALREGKITRLYESSLTIADNKDKVPENTGGIITAYRKGCYNLGVFYYNQQFSSAFADTTFTPVHDVFGVFAFISAKPVSIGFETDQAGRKTAATINAKYWSDHLQQSLHYIYRPDAYPLSYARTGQIFGQKTGSEEVSWDVGYRPFKHWKFTGRMAAFKDLTGETDTDWKERLIFAVNYLEAGWQSGFTYYRFRKDAIQYADTLAADILPVQNRLKAQWTRIMSDCFRFTVTAQYQHYLDRKVTKNGFSLQQSVKYSSKAVDIGLSFTAWTNQKSTYQPTELPTDEELLIQSDSDSAFRIYLKRRINRRFSVYLNAYRPNTKVSKQSYWLNLQTEI